MLVHLALFNDFLIDLSFVLGTVILLLLRLFFLLVETSEVEVLMSPHKLLIIDLVIEVHIIEVLQLVDLGAFVGESVGGLLIIHQCKFGCSFGYLDHPVVLLVLHQPLLGHVHLLDPLAVGVGHLVGVLVEGREHRCRLTLLQQLVICHLLAHRLLIRLFYAISWTINTPIITRNNAPIVIGKNHLS